MERIDHTDRCVFSHQHNLYPGYRARSMWHFVLSCGHALVKPDWGISARGNCFLLQYLLRGRGWVTTHDRRLAAKAGEVIFLDCHVPYQLEVDPGDPWEIYWATFDSAIGHRWIEHMDCDRHPVLPVAKPSRVATRFRELCRFTGRQLPGFEGQMSAIIHGIVSDLYSEQAKARARGLVSAAAPATERLHLEAPLAVRNALNLFHRSYHRPLARSELVAASGVSRSRLYTLFQQHVGCSPMAYLCDYRIHCAKDLLEHTSLPIKSISPQVGIMEVSYFSRLFRRKAGMSARQYRARRNRQLHRRTPAP